MFLDLDRFKLLNDTMGHSAGDELLVDVAERLQQSAPDGALIARVGGDEFLIVIDAVTSVEDVLETCEQIRLAIEVPFALRGGQIFTSVSIGVALATDNALARQRRGNDPRGRHRHVPGQGRRDGTACRCSTRRCGTGSRSD